MSEAKKTGNGTDDEEIVVDAELLQFREEVAYLSDEQTPFSGVADKRYENGQKLSRTNYKDGRMEGLLTAWFENGDKEMEGYYKGGKLNGPYISSWYSNGQKEEENNWKDGKLDGLWSVWYENGEKGSEAIYRNGELISKKEWDPDGTPI